MEKLLKRYLYDYLYLFTLTAVIILIDQVTKGLVRANLQYSELWSPWEWLMPYIRIVNWTNSGAAFGMFQGLSGVFSILAIVVAGMIIYYFPQISSKDWALRLALGMQLGGALGNLIDRIRFDGHVTDFISVGNFPVFNVADASITVGVAILVVGMWVKEQELKKQEAAAASNSHSSELTQVQNDLTNPDSYSSSTILGGDKKPDE